MGRERSDATKLRDVNSQLAFAKKIAADESAAMTHWRNRAIAAENDALDWKKRFDALLARDTEMARKVCYEQAARTDCET
jgi:hypothetical protein